MPCFNFLHKNIYIHKDASNRDEVKETECTLDGTVDRHGNQAIRAQIGRWKPGIILLVNQGLATLAFFGIGVNLVLFLTRVLGQNNADAANNVSKWTGTMYLFSLLGAFLSDSYWGRYKTCAIFQAIFLLGLSLLSLLSYLFLLKPRECGDEQTPCDSHTSFHKALFYMSIYMVALGMGGYQPNIAIFGADQFDEQDIQEKKSKESYFSYYVLALNFGSLFSKTILGYFEDGGKWAFGFWASTGSASTGFLLFLVGTPYYRHFIPRGNPFSKFFNVFVAALSKQRARIVPQEGECFNEMDTKTYSKNGWRNIFHTRGLTFLDRATIITSLEDKNNVNGQKKLCTITQVEEVKCILRVIPIWLCTIFYSVVFAQMSSLFIEQGAAMNKTITHFHISPSTLSIFNILSVAAFIYIYRHVLNPLVTRLRNKGLTELERMGIGLIIAFLAMMAAGIVEIYRLKYATVNCNKCENPSSLSISWQIPQYMLIGGSEVFMGVARLEFFYGQAPEGLKCFGNALCLTSVALGNYLSSIIATIVMKISTRNGMPGWIPEDLNKGHLDRFYFLLSALITIDFGVYLFVAGSYRYVESEVLDLEKS
ncbi:hypothetical protein KSS87_011550 [Heliosperma pusillum]|nr:hypothetical protein KSS87_023374 [Heliosperma pusillum]KAH9622689.1 hypothetical protein KSS87_011550 [Heliosperma pusillum]